MTRNRDDGFARMDWDVNFWTSPKVSRLFREMGRDNPATYPTLAAYQMTVIASWRDGYRVALADAVPLFWTDAHDAQQALSDLQRVGLLDRDGKVPEEVWERWHGPAARSAYQRKHRFDNYNKQQKAKRQTADDDSSDATDDADDDDAGVLRG